MREGIGNVGEAMAAACRRISRNKSLPEPDRKYLADLSNRWVVASERLKAQAIDDAVPLRERIGDANLTPKQMALLHAFQDFRSENGYSPTFQELSDVLGVSKVTVFEHIRQLVIKGVVTHTRKARSLTWATRSSNRAA